MRPACSWPARSSWPACQGSVARSKAASIRFASTQASKSAGSSRPSQEPPCQSAMWSRNLDMTPPRSNSMSSRQPHGERGVACFGACEGGGANWQPHGKSRPLAFGTREANGAAVQFDTALDDGQAETAAGNRANVGRAMEGAKQPVTIRLGDANAFVSHL